MGAAKYWLWTDARTRAMVGIGYAHRARDSRAARSRPGKGTLMFHTSKEPTGNASGRGAAATRIVGPPVRQQRLQPARDAERELLIRLAGPEDRPALDRLAALDSQAPLQGDALIAKLDGVAVAALSFRDGRLVADPFRRTAAIGDHLRLRASSITATTGPTAPLFKRLLRIAPARAAWLSEGSR